MAAETLFQELKRYVRFDDRDARVLAAFHPHAAPHFPRIAQDFYDRIREHEGAHDVFTGEDQIARLRQSLQRWLDRICLGPHDEAYFEETSKIGRMHVKVGLPQQYTFTAMALIRVELLHIAATRGGPESEATRDAITRVLDLELAVMLEAYRHDFIARIQHVDRLEKQQLQGALARAQHRYINAVELARVCLVGIDRRGLVRLFNREAERVTGFGRDEILGEPFLTLIPEELHGELRSHLAAATAGGQPQTETEIRTRAGKIREMRFGIAYAPSEDEDEVVTFLLGQDVTEEKAQTESARQREKLAAVGTLAAGLAHEIRNPLNGAQLHVSFLERSLQRSGADSDSLEAVQVVGDEIKRLAVLVTEFLDFARPKPLDRKATSMATLCERVFQLAVSEASAVKVALVADLPGQDIVLDADGAKLEQVLLNLVRNAVEALAEGGGGQVILRGRRQPRFAVLEVEDDGPGLTSPEAPVFDAFYSTKPNGTGLGLSIAHRIVTDHGGTIAAESQPGRTVFRITLPLTQSATSLLDR
jgi:PAS domain S-box-containing protein